MRKINNPSEINRKIQNWESISSEEKVSTWIYLDRLNQSNSSYFSNRLYYLKLIYKILLTGDFLSFERFVQRIINLTNQHYFFITNIENEFDAELNFKIQIDPSNDEENIRYLKEIEILINLEDNKNKIIDTIHKERCLSLIGKMYETNGDDELINNMSKALRIPSLIQISINQEEFPQLMDELIKFDFYEVVIPVYQRVCDRWSEEPEIPVAILSEIIKSGRLSQKKEIELYLSYVTSENYVNNMEEICIGNQVKFAEKFKKATEEIWNTIPFCREDTKICLIDFTYASIINNFDRSVECNKYFYENIIPEKIKEYISADLIDTSCRKFGQPLHCLFLNPTYYDPDFRLEKVINAIKSKDGRERAQEDLINTAVSSNFFLSIEQAEELFDLVSGEENMYVRNILFGAGAGFPPQIRLHFFYKLG
ncbi:MAG: hypothetical protein JJ979_17320, partial [Roseibium sp.]|nr:hypothetical protein [Roseibium sp.]